MAFMRVYRSYEEFERDELRQLDGLSSYVDDMLDQMFAEEVDGDGDGEPGGSSRRGRRRKAKD